MNTLTLKSRKSNCSSYTYVQCPLILVIVPLPMVWYVVYCIFSYWLLYYRRQVYRWIEKIAGLLVFCGTFWWEHLHQPTHVPVFSMAANQFNRKLWTLSYALSLVQHLNLKIYLAGTTEAVFHHIYSASIRFSVH